MNILITGIDGFVGSHLAAHFLHQGGVTIYGLVRALPPMVPLDPSIILRSAEITDPDAVRAVVTEAMPDRIFHLAGQAFVPLSIENPRGTFQTNVDGTLNLLEAVREDNVLRNKTSVLVVSSGEVYGDVTPEMLPLNELSPLRPANPYAVSKACVDMISRQYCASFGIDVTVARPFNHLGPGQNELFVGSAFARQIAEIKLGRREPKLLVGNLEPKRDFTDVRDVVRAYASLLDLPKREPAYNICSGRSLAIRDLLDRMLLQSGMRVEILRDPKRSRREEIAEIRGDASLLRQATGWEPKIPIEQTLRDILSYWDTRLATGA